MKPVRSLPEGYQLLRVFDLKNEQRLLVLLNLAGLALFAGFGALFIFLIAWVRPETPAGMFNFSGNLLTVFIAIFKALAVYAGALVLHEVIHGVFFWMITRTAPKFGLGSAYAFAAAPDWYIPRNRYLLVGLAPLVVMTVAGLLVLPVIPVEALLYWWFVLTVNASGAVGDLFVVGWLMFRSPHALINDYGDRICVYAPVG